MSPLCRVKRKSAYLEQLNRPGDSLPEVVWLVNLTIKSVSWACLWPDHEWIFNRRENAMAKRFRLNSLSRFTKESERLILETHSAGCGGIVLRWRDPDEGLPIFLLCYSSLEMDTMLDGKPVGRRPIIKPGEHVLAIRCGPSKLRDVTPHYLSQTATIDSPESGFMDSEVIPELTSNTRWKCSVEHEPGWETDGFDDSNWENMSPLLESDAPGFQYFRQNVESAGGNVLQIPDAVPVYVRFRFELGERSV